MSGFILILIIFVIKKVTDDNRARFIHHFLYDLLVFFLEESLFHLKVTIYLDRFYLWEFYLGIYILCIINTVTPQYLRRELVLGTPCRHQNLRMLKSFIWNGVVFAYNLYLHTHNSSSGPIASFTWLQSDAHLVANSSFALEFLVGSVFSIPGWLNPWIWNPQIERASFIYIKKLNKS